MDLKDILVKLKLNENGQIDESVVQDIENYISEAVEVKAKDMAHSMTKEIVEPIVNEQKEELIKEYEEKFEEYKKMITERFSDFVDTVLDENLEIPENIKEYAKVGELYSSWINDFKKIAGIDENAVNEEAKDLLREARDEIVSLESQVNEQEAKLLELKESGRKIAAELYVRQKCDGLTESQKTRVLTLLDGISDRQVIDEKFDKIKEILFDKEINEKKTQTQTTPTTEQKETICICPNCGKETTVTEGSCNLYNCPDCEDVKLVEKSEKKQAQQNENKNQQNGFSSLLNEYVDILKNKKI